MNKLTKFSSNRHLFVLLLVFKSFDCDIDGCFQYSDTKANLLVTVILVLDLSLPFQVMARFIYGTCKRRNVSINSETKAV